MLLYDRISVCQLYVRVFSVLKDCPIRPIVKCECQFVSTALTFTLGMWSSLETLHWSNVCSTFISLAYVRVVLQSVQ